MSGFPIVDLVIGIIFVYFLLSIVTSSGVELILTGGKYRAKMLETWLRSIFNNNVSLADGTSVTLGQAIMDHCSINALSSKGNSTSYIDAKNFASALLEKITYNPDDPTSVATDINDFITYIKNTTALPSDLKRLLLGYAIEAKETYKAISNKTESEIDLFYAKIEDWFNSNMDRVGGALKTRYSRPFTLIVASITVIFLNADSIAIAKYLYSNPDVRTQLAAQALIQVNDTSTQSLFIKQKVLKSDSLVDTSNKEQLDDMMHDQLNQIKKAKGLLDNSMPLSWKKYELDDESGSFSFLKLFSKITGLLATILAIMMGAPFWFDLLNKISNLRGSGTKPKEKN